MDEGDLVKRLREYALPSAEDYPDWHPEICSEAADEIERLRAALEMIAGTRPCTDNLLGNADIARLALEQTLDK